MNHSTLHIIFANDRDMIETGLANFVDHGGRHHLIGEILFGAQTVRLYAPTGVQAHSYTDRHADWRREQALTPQQTAMLQSIVVALTSNGQLQQPRIEHDGNGDHRHAPPQAEAAENGQEAAVGVQLSGREREVLALMARGLRNHQIAAALSISIGTVKKHVSNILFKLEATGRTEAVARAVRCNLVSEE